MYIDVWSSIDEQFSPDSSLETWHIFMIIMDRPLVAEQYFLNLIFKTYLLNSYCIWSYLVQKNLYASDLVLYDWHSTCSISKSNKMKLEVLTICP